MRAEDLFEAIGELDEQMIALSEENSLEARKASKESGRYIKRKKRAQIYRFAAIAMTTAAAVFVLLTAKDLITTRSRSYTQSAAESAEYIQADGAAEAAQDTLAAGAEELEAESDTEAVAKYSAPQDYDSEEAAEQSENAIERDAEREAARNEAQKAAESAQADMPAAEAAEEAAAQEVAEAADELAQASEEASEEMEMQDAEKTAVDMLGDFKGDYVKLEIISAQELADGGERRVPEYTKEREEALTSALEDGERRATMFVSTGEPLYYVYLTDIEGDVDTVTFYENGYVGIDTIPGFVMKISNEAFEEVKKMFN